MQLVPILHVAQAPMPSHTPCIQFIVAGDGSGVTFAHGGGDDFDSLDALEQFGCGLVKRSLVQHTCVEKKEKKDEKQKSRLCSLSHM